MNLTTPAVTPAYLPMIPLRAGPLTLAFCQGDLRHLRVEDVEVIQRIYVAVRDARWNTIPVTLHDLELDDQGDSFQVRFRAVHRLDEIGFSWDGTILGRANGSIEYHMDGRADTTFARNRIGICVLHPATCAGASITLEHTDGRRARTRFPARVSPHQPFLDLAAMTHTVRPGLRAEVRFSGDIFESEDQRNWTDASFKTYSTPLALPIPVTIAAGTPVQQSVTLRLRGKVAPARTPDPDPLRVTISPVPLATLPPLGVGMASHGAPLTADEAAALRALKLAHLRVDVDLHAADLADTLARAQTDAAAIGAALEIALHADTPQPADLARLSAAVTTQRPTVARWLLLSKTAPVTPAALLKALRPTLNQLTPGVPIGGGTNQNFTELNRHRPRADALAHCEFVGYAMTPQVHAFDPLSLVENLAAQPTTVTSARDFCRDRSLVISPITLRPRPHPLAPPPAAPSTRLPSGVDARQATSFAAAWTLGSLSNLAHTGQVASLTYFETTGWRGLLERATGSPQPDLFPSHPGQRFPLYHLFAALADYADAAVLQTISSDPLTVAALSLRTPARRLTLVGNLTDRPITVEVSGHAAPLTLRTQGDDDAGELEVDPGLPSVELELPPYALVSLESPT